MLSVLSDTQKAIVEVMTMRLLAPQALEYLKNAGHEMSRSKYFRQRKKIEEMKLERMHYIAKYFPDQHLERIDRCELIEKLCWENYHACKDPAKKVKILESIITIQPYLSSYYEATKIVLESTIKDRVSPDRDLIPPIVDIEDINGVEKEPDWSEGWLQCGSCKRWWSRKELLDYHKKKTVCGISALEDEKEDI